MIQYFYSPGSRTMTAFLEAVSSDLLQHIEQVQAYRDTKPKHGHVVLVAGEGKPSPEAEKFAARIGAFCACVPECSDWLTGQIRKRIELNLPFVMVDAALATTSQLSGAK